MSFDPQVVCDLVRAACPSVWTTSSEDMVTVNVHFFDVQVYKSGAEAIRSLLIEQLDQWPEVDQFGNRPGDLKGGLSYIAIGSAVGSQEVALMLLAVGQVCGIWSVVTPARLGITGEKADQMAGGGFVMADGYRPTSNQETQT